MGRGQPNEVNPTVTIRTSEALLRWRRPAITLVALLIIAVEVMEHQPDSLNQLNSNFLREVWLFGVGFPLLGGILFSPLMRRKLVTPGPLTSATSNKTNVDTTMQRVLIVENELLLGAGIEHLLAGEADLNVRGIARADEAVLLEEIKLSQPDVVILDEATCLTDPMKLLAHLQDHPRLRVIVVSANDNVVQIFDKQQVLVNQTSDLASLFYTVIAYSKGATTSLRHTTENENTR